MLINFRTLIWVYIIRNIVLTGSAMELESYGTNSIYQYISADSDNILEYGDIYLNIQDIMSDYLSPNVISSIDTKSGFKEINKVNVNKNSTVIDSLDLNKNINLASSIFGGFSILQNRIGTRLDVLNILKFNWCLGDINIKFKSSWIALQLAMNAETYKEMPSDFQIITTYNQCLDYISRNETINNISLKENDNIGDFARYVCGIYGEYMWSISSKDPTSSPLGKVPDFQYLEDIESEIPNTGLYDIWLAIYKIDPSYSQWFLLYKIASNEIDEFITIFKYSSNYNDLLNVIVEFMEHTDYYEKSTEIFGRQYTSNKHKKHGITGKSSKRFKIHLPKDMPNMYIYHHRQDSCVLNLAAMTLFPDTRVNLDIEKPNRSSFYYVFHRKNVAVSRKSFLRSNQICFIMLATMEIFEKRYYITENRKQKAKYLTKPLPFDPFYYSIPSNIDDFKMYVYWLLYPKSQSINKLVNHTNNMLVYLEYLAMKYQDSKLLKWEYKSFSNRDLTKLRDRNFKMLEFKRELDHKLQEIKLMTRISNSISSLNDNRNYYPTMYSIIPLITISTKYWKLRKNLNKYPVRIDINLPKTINILNDIKFDTYTELGYMPIYTSFECIKGVILLWKYDGLLINRRPFRLLDPRLVHVNNNRKQISKIYADYATIYLLCSEIIIKAINYQRTYIKIFNYDTLKNSWKIQRILDLSDPNNQNSFEYNTKHNLILHSLPDRFPVHNLTKSIHGFFIAGSIFLLIGSIVLDSLLSIFSPLG
ncbi:hypothetical protein cand_022820 [Cryptosporidium andersoni]|uniref:Uncharacterized protein n=1 Tax=Cryptosporidium andersoni TaxID=117008 RepID=A0A1J4MU20_9CRYT|nr:hypothetical protein cand_022820 [Cryptosporidium andersoni]